MRIGFYGHCTAAWSTRPLNISAPFRENEESLVDIVCKHFDAIVVNLGVNQGSIERALLDLKKTKQLDVAIVFYPQSSRFYLPRTNRDIDLKYFNNTFKDTKAKYIWNVQKDRSRNIIWNIEKWQSKQVEGLFFDQKNENIKDVYDSVEEFITTLSLYKKYLHNQDVHINRWYGSLIQIDQYLYAKKIPCIHVIDKNIIPSWFKFQSGTVATYIAEFETKFHVGYTSPNSISMPGQKIIADALITEIEKITNNSPLTSDK